MSDLDHRSLAEQYDAAQIMAAISAALRADDLPAVVDLMKVLALVSPVDCRQLCAAMELAGISTGVDP